MIRTILCFSLAAAATFAQTERRQLPGPSEDGYFLPNGWTITPLGTAIPTHDLITNIVPSPDGARMVAVTSGYNLHELVLIDTKNGEATQRVALPNTFFGLAFNPAGDVLYVSGGNNLRKDGIKSSIYQFDYDAGKLSEVPIQLLGEDNSVDQKEIYWSGLAHHPTKPILYAANRTAGNVVAFDSKSKEILGRVRTEVNPYDLLLSPGGATLYCSNWASDSVSVIDTATLAVTATIPVGDNPNDMELGPDGRLYVACSNDNTVYVVGTKAGRATERIVTSLYEMAPEGSTPNALSLDEDGEILFVANADNNNICVVNVEDPGEATVLGFLPAGWYPSAVRVGPEDAYLYVGNGKGVASFPSVHHPKAGMGKNDEGYYETTKTTMHGTVNVVKLDDYRANLRELTAQCYKNSPYNDTLLTKANPPKRGPSVVPSAVGAGSPIKHVIYIIKENRTYDQVLGDIPRGNGDPRLCLFDRKVTPNAHKIAEEFVLLDNLYCDAEVSRDGHAWSNAAYATDFVEKLWPASYGGIADGPYTEAAEPSAGYIWDLCAKKGLTYRSYGEYARQQEEGGPMLGRKPGLVDHVSPDYLNWGARDYENAKVFIREFNEYVANYDKTDPELRLPNFIVMGLPEDHTVGTRPGKPTPKAAVASNDYALGQIVDVVSHSPYWQETAIFVIQDDAQDGPDHVDARRTVGFVISPYTHRKTVDSTFYTTSSMLRTIELLLGLPPMSQFDAAATPMYASLSDTPDLTPYDHLEPTWDLYEVNVKTAWGASESEAMDWSEYDRAPMLALNEIVWKSVKGEDEEMPLPLHRFVRSSLEPIE